MCASKHTSPGLAKSVGKTVMSQFHHAAATVINWVQKCLFQSFQLKRQSEVLQINGIITERTVNTAQSKYPIQVERRKNVENVFSMEHCIFRGLTVPSFCFKLLFIQIRKD